MHSVHSAETVTETIRQMEDLALNRNIPGLRELRDEILLQLHLSPASPLLQALSQAVNGYVASAGGNAAQAITHFQLSGQTFTTLDIPWNAALMTLRAGDVLYDQSQYHDAMQSYHDALQQFHMMGDKAMVARLSENMAMTFLKLGNLDDSATLFMQAVDIQEQLNNQRGVMHLKANLGNLYLERGELEEAMQFYKEALEGFIQVGSKVAIATLSTNIGICYADKADYPNALLYLHRALDAGNETDHKISLSATTGAMGEIYEACGDHDKALHWFERSLQLSISSGRINDVCRKRIQIGITLLHMNRENDAAYQLETAQTLANELGDRRELNRVCAHLAMVRLGQGRPAEARAFINSALEGTDSSGFVRDLLSYRMIDAHIAMAEKNFTRCNQILDVAIQSARTMSAEKELSEILYMQYQIERLAGNMLAALKKIEEYIVVHNNYLGLQRQRHMAILEIEQKIYEQTLEHERKTIEERTIREQQRKLLTNILPETIANRLIAGEKVVADRFNEVSVMFLDLVNFTGLASRVPPEHILILLNAVFGTCDSIVQRHGLTKIKTIGDSYMAVSGAPIEQADNVVRMVNAALEMREVLSGLSVRIPDEYGDRSWVKNVGDIEVRIGIHCGPVSAGIIGEERMAYDVWGDTVNISARMEQTGSPSLIHVTSHFHDRVMELYPQGADFVHRGEVEVKGRGVMDTWWMHQKEQG